MKKERPVNEKTLRLKYIRVLERFVSRAVALLKHSDFNIDIFKVNIDKYYQEIQKTKAVRLDSQYHQKLQHYVNMTLNLTQTDSSDFQEQQLLLLKEANLLHKEKNKTNYKKDKHKKKNYHNEY